MPCRGVEASEGSDITSWSAIPCSIAFWIALRICEEVDVVASENLVSWDLSDMLDPGEGRNAGYVKTESESTKNERELLLLREPMLCVLALELANAESFDLLGFSSRMSSTRTGGGVDLGWLL